jgi:hypothetical protein
MPSLNSYGKIDAAAMVVYIPIFAISLVLVFRHGFKRDAGWIFLCIFSLSKIHVTAISYYPNLNFLKFELLEAR